MNCAIVSRKLAFLGSLALLLSLTANAIAAEPAAAARRAADLFPASAVAYAELSEPGKLAEGILAHPLVARALMQPEAKQALESPQYQQFRLVLGLVEAQMGMPWRDALKDVTGVYAAGDIKTEGVAVLIHAKKPETLTKLTTALLNLARLDAQRKSQPDPIQEGEYRGSKTYAAGEGRAAIHGNWLLLCNVESLAREVMDNLAADQPAAATPTLAADGEFKSALATRGDSGIAWAWLRLGPLREKGPLAYLQSEKANDAGAEVLFGGLLSVLGKTPFITATVQTKEDSLRVAIAVPHDPTWVRPARDFYFGAGSQGSAPPLLSVKNTLGAISFHRDLSAIWTSSDELFNDQDAAKVEQADAGLSTFFSGKEFGKDILGQFEPGVQIVVARQEFGPERQPAIKLPAAAIVLGLKETDKIDRQMRVSFQSLIGFLNIVGAQNGQSQLELHNEKRDGAEYNWASYAPGETTPQDPGRLHDNFSPSLVIVGKRMIVASTIDLATELAKATPAPAAASARRSNFAISVDGPAIVDALRENRQHLVAQNVLEKGNSEERAGKEIDLALEIASWLSRANIELSIADGQLRLDAAVKITKP